MTYYYVCSYPLESGSIIRAGNWGRINKIHSIPPANPVNLLREVVFENVRLQRFPDRPSRFNCNFLCPNISSFREFIKRKPLDLHYEVELVNPDAKRFETDWSLIATYPNILAMEEAAVKYWNPENVTENLKELLVESDIRISRRLNL
jgi:hypothetical protein